MSSNYQVQKKKKKNNIQSDRNEARAYPVAIAGKIRRAPRVDPRSGQQQASREEVELAEAVRFQIKPASGFIGWGPLFGDGAPRHGSSERPP